VNFGAPIIAAVKELTGRPVTTIINTHCHGDHVSGNVEFPAIEGPDQMELYYFGRGHTNGDAWILFPAQRVVHAGDIFAWNNQIPILDSNNGASGVSYPDTLMKAHAALSKSADRIITGHSTVMTFNDLRAFADFNRSFLDAARAAKKKGQTVDDTAPITSRRKWILPSRMTT
jgi:glyoxylase-like metal-dependent hydrolase (beta-lactamase superfamily II)